MEEPFFPLTPTDTKKVKVRVDASSNEVHATPPVLHMGNGHFQFIQWTIETDGWAFPTFRLGVELKVPNSQFTNGSVTEPNVFRISDTNLATGDHEYTIRVVNPSTGEQLELDPTIKNQG
jgi:hypothetical protein